MRQLELLAPARNLDIGIAAIDCGADAVYMAGPLFGARQAAGNSVEDIAQLCRHAHQYGARVFVTVNTIAYDSELQQAKKLLQELQQAGADALIVQDLAIMKMATENIDIPVHASTQCSIRTPEKARWLKSLGCSRLVVERQTSLEQIREIGEAFGSELECFVHGALCVCYSGECYLSEHLAGRSANRGACIQACRSKYDLVDSSGRVIARNKALLSLKDFRLLDRMEELAEAGVCSFKIEGRLKNISYVRNVVREYSLCLDELVKRRPEEYCRSSYGQVVKGFAPAVDKTFNRGYTALFIDGKRPERNFEKNFTRNFAEDGKGWACLDAAKGMGEYVGTVESVSRDGRGLTLRMEKGAVLANGDGFSFVDDSGEVVGFRGDICSGNSISTGRMVKGVQGRTKVYRNISAAFEKELERNRCVREIAVDLEGRIEEGGVLSVLARSEDGRSCRAAISSQDIAENRERSLQSMASQLSKTCGIYRFSCPTSQIAVEEGCNVPFFPTSALNALRRELCAMLEAMPCKGRPMAPKGTWAPEGHPQKAAFTENIANKMAEEICREGGALHIEQAYELAHQNEAALMRSKYCIRHELGLCPTRQSHKKEGGPAKAAAGELYLINNGRKLALKFDCKACEMTVYSCASSKSNTRSTVPNEQV